MTTNPFASFACTMFARSVKRSPRRPLIGGGDAGVHERRRCRPAPGPLDVASCANYAPHHRADQRALGLRLTDPGNMVHANDAKRVWSSSRAPNRSVCRLRHCRDSLPPSSAKLKRRRSAWPSTRTIASSATGWRPDRCSPRHVIDPSTGTGPASSGVPPTRQPLFPNQFVNARLLVDVKRGRKRSCPRPAFNEERRGRSSTS